MTYAAGLQQNYRMASLAKRKGSSKSDDAAPHDRDLRTI
jgi:hypothetical protein